MVFNFNEIKGFNTAPIEELQRLNYPRQYEQKKMICIQRQQKKSLGFKTDPNTRPIIMTKEIQ